jgi:hypothetical protein
MQPKTALFTIGVAITGVAAAGLLSLTSVSQAATTTGPDLAMTTASVVDGVKVMQSGGQLVPFSFTAKNNSTTTADLNFTFTITNGTADPYQYICPLVGTKFDINPDTDVCEVGALAAGHGSSAGVIVAATGPSGQYVTVKGCAIDFTISNGSDTVPSNNCKTLKVRIS